MTHFPVVMSADRRWRYGMAPLRLQNLFAQPLPREANKPVRAVLLPTPGLVSRLDMGATIQGVFCENGVRNGLLHVVAGGRLYSVSRSWVKTLIGTIGGTGDAVFAGLRDVLYTAQDRMLWGWDGASFGQVTDVDAPAVASMCVLAQRLVAIEENSDTIFWSNTLDGTSWDALAFATAEQRPDILRVLIKLSGQFIPGGAASLEVWRATGNSQLPFANITAQSIDETEGILGPQSYAIRGDKVYFIGGNLSPYVMAGFSVTPLPNCGELDDELLALNEEGRLAVSCWAYTMGPNEFFKVRLPGKPAFVFNSATGFWHTELSWEEDTYKPKFQCSAYGYDVIADEDGSVLYTLSADVYTAAGTTVERIATLRPGFTEYEAVGSMCVDLQAFGRPLSGQGSDPSLMISISTDGRADRDDTRSEVTITAGPDGTYLKPVLWGLGRIPPGEGATITLRLTDPVGMGLYGVWLNDGQRS